MCNKIEKRIIFNILKHQPTSIQYHAFNAKVMLKQPKFYKINCDIAEVAINHKLIAKFGY
jgi:hypothetical protein